MTHTPSFALPIDETAVALARADADIEGILRRAGGGADRAAHLLTRAWNGSDSEVFVAALVARLVVQHDRMARLGSLLEELRS